MKSEPSDHSLPKVQCDFNACGFSGTPTDNCFYVLCLEELGPLQPREGMRIIVWDWSDFELVLGCEAVLERYEDSWRARPKEDTWYEQKPDQTYPRQD